MLAVLSQPRRKALHALFMHLGVLTGLFVLLSQVWNYAPIDRIVLTSLGGGLGVYLVLTVAFIAIHRILAHASPPEQTDDRADTETPSDRHSEAPDPSAQDENAPPAETPSEKETEPAVPAHARAA